MNHLSKKVFINVTINTEVHRKWQLGINATLFSEINVKTDVYDPNYQPCYGINAENLEIKICYG